MMVPFFLRHGIGKTTNSFEKAGRRHDAIINMAAGGNLQINKVVTYVTPLPR